MTRYLFVACAALLSACSSHQGRPDKPAPDTGALSEFSVVENVTYTPSEWPGKLTADIYRPAGVGPFPAIVMVHGGGWNGRTRADMNRYSEMAAARGYVVMNVSYRLAPLVHFPGQLQDLQQAVLWLREHAEAQQVRAERIAAWGYSAGAHLASLLGTTGPGDKYFVTGARVQAVVAGGTPVDLRDYPEGKLVNGLMGVPLLKDPQLWRDASPLVLVTQDDPPTFLYHGTLDYTVDVNNARRMYAALEAAHVPAELYLVRGIEHITTFWIDAPAKRGLEFLDRQLR